MKTVVRSSISWRAQGKGTPNPDQLQRYIDNGCHWFYELPDHMKYFRHVNWAYLDWATFFGFVGKPDTVTGPTDIDALESWIKAVPVRAVPQEVRVGVVKG